MLLTKDDIRAVNDIAFEDVDVPEWGGTVRVKTLTGAERDEFEASIVERRGKKTEMNLRDVRAKLVVKAAVDGSGALLFEARDVAWLTQKSAAALERVSSVAQRLAGLRDEDLEELAKNSGSGQSDDSTFV